MTLSKATPKEQCFGAAYRLVLPLFLSLCGAAMAALAPGPIPAAPGPVTTDGQLIAALDLDTPGMEKVKAAIESGDLTAAKAAYLDYRRIASPVKWNPMPSEEPAATEQTDAVGDGICAHQIPNHFGFYTKVVDMGKDFDWYRNPVAKTDPSYSAEFTWCVIARTPFWRELADAYWKTHDEKYAVEWVNELNDFVTKVPMPPPEVDVEIPDPPFIWRGLETAIRMNDTWPYAYYHFLNSPSFTPDAQWTYLKSSYEHGLSLRNGLKNQSRTGNHVTTEAFGLYAVGAVFPELKAAQGWRQDALSRLTLEMNRIVPPDGFETELTPGYHTVALDDFRGPVLLAKLNNLPVPDEFMDKIMSMYRAMVLVMDQSGYDVPTNDSWPVDVRKQAARGLELADDPLLRWAVSNGTEGTAPPDSTMLPYAGFYTMRAGWKPDDLFLFFRAGPTGIGHEHEDMLEVVLRAWGKTLLLDPGTYNYDHSEWRRYILGTSAHNTIIVDGKWQHRGTSKPGPNGPVPMDNPWVTTPLFDYAAGTYSGGYQENVYAPLPYHPDRWVGELDKSVSHTRRVFFLRPGYALVLDTLDGSGHHVFDAHFHLDAPAATLDAATQAAFSKNPEGAQLALYPLELDNLKTEIIQGQKDPMLGWVSEGHRPIPTVRFRKEQDAPAIFATFLYPYKGGAPHFESKPLPCDGSGLWSRTLTTSGETIDLALELSGHAGSIAFKSDSVGSVQAEATFCLVRHPVAGDAVYVGGKDLSSYRDSTVALTLDTPSSIVFSNQGGAVLVYNGEEKPIQLTLQQPFASTATLPPGAWTSITPTGAAAASPPSLFGSLP